MDIFGLTPTDTALSVLGLNYAYLLISYIFIQTPWGTCAFVVGFLLSLWKSSQTSNFRPLIIFVLSFFAILLLIVTPQRQEGTIKSEVENLTATNPSAQAIKDAQANIHTIPMLSSFIGQAIDSIFIGAVNVITTVMPTEENYLKEPFLIHQISLEANNDIRVGIQDIHLKERLSKFLYDYYVPALAMSRNTSTSGNNLSSLGPDNSSITAFYSQNTQTQWNTLKTDLNHTIDDPKGNWIKIKDFINKSFQISDQDADTQIINSYAQAESERSNYLWRVVGAGLNLWPYVQGIANLCLNVFFPIIILITLIAGQFNLLFYYGRTFIWVKSWVLTGALAYYASLTVAHIQALNSPTNITWFWQKPYYSIVGVIFLYLMPCLTFCMINITKEKK